MIVFLLILCIGFQAGMLAEVSVIQRARDAWQEVVVEEAVAAVDAWGREALSELCARVLGAPATAVALAGRRAMGPFRPLLFPVPTPLELLTRYSQRSCNPALPVAVQLLFAPWVLRVHHTP